MQGCVVIIYVRLQ